MRPRRRKPCWLLCAALLCGAAPGGIAGQSTNTVLVDGVPRRFIAYVPRSYADSPHPVPLLFMFHGLGSTAEQAASPVYDWQTEAETNRFIVLFPDSLTPPGKDIEWPPGSGITLIEDYDGTGKRWDIAHILSNGNCRCRSPDLDFVEAMIDWAADNYTIRPSEVFTTGHSYGAFFSYYAAVCLRGRVEGFAAHSGGATNYALGATNLWWPIEPPADGRSLSGILLHSPGDAVVPYTNSQRLAAALAARDHTVELVSLPAALNHAWDAGRNREQWDFLSLHARGRARPFHTNVIAPYFIQWGVYGRNYHVTNLPATRISHLLYAFARPDYDHGSGTASLASSDPNADYQASYPGDDAENPPYRGSFNQLRKLKQKHPHLRTLISVGGWTFSSNFSAIAAAPRARGEFADSCATFMTNYDFDGIDIDWEYPVQGGAEGNLHAPQDADRFLLLLRAMRRRLDRAEDATGRSYLLTVATSAYPPSLPVRYRLRRMAESLDWIGAMTYDYTGPWDGTTGHNAPLYAGELAIASNLNVDATMRAHLAAGVPHGRLVVGLPWYGRSFAGVPDVQHGLFQTHTGAGEGTWESGVLDYGDLAGRFVDTNGYARYWDPQACVPYLYNATSGVFVTYDDADSLHWKLRYVNSNRFAGVMSWSVDADTRRHALQRQAYRASYPLSFSSIASTTRLAGASVAVITWQGLEGEEYRLRQRSVLGQSDWSNCVDLVDMSDQPVGPALPGRDTRMSVVDTNPASGQARFYELMRVGTQD